MPLLAELILHRQLNSMFLRTVNWFDHMSKCVKRKARAEHEQEAEYPPLSLNAARLSVNTMSIVCNFEGSFKTVVIQVCGCCFHHLILSHTCRSV